MRPDRLLYSDENCSIGRTLDLVGEKWTLLVLREAFYGLRRFADLQQAVGCARNVLSARLRKLVDEGIMTTQPYRDPGARARFEYHLTAKGLELLPVLLALMQWGDRWTADADGPAIAVRHRGCGRPIHVDLGCSAGHAPLTADDTQAVPGPGARRMDADLPRRRRPPSVPIPQRRR